MTDALIQTVLDYGALGAFAVYLAIQQNKLQTALEKLTRRFQDQIDSLQTRHEEREDTLRARYDVVIQDLNNHRDQMQRTMSEALTRSSDKLEDLEAQVRELRMSLTK
jgi:DNA anti-recombination protein RmuC